MDPVRHARVKALFERALPLAEAEREALLAAECGADPELAREVADLLQHHRAAGDFLTGRAGPAPDEPALPRIAIPGYRLERELGRGGMGIVWLAEQERPRRPVALKFLRLDSLAAADVERFRREAEILGRLRHPGIAHVYAVGRAASEHGDLPWIAMEYVHGVPLCDYAAQHVLDLRGQVELFVQLCEALQHAHESGVVHRDLKPSNVLVDERGRVRVLDFGVARLVGDAAGGEGGPRTRTGQMLGTLAYASPEQASGRVREVGAPSDVYALGVMLHELLTGELPYAIDESKIVEAIQAICDEEPRRLRKARREAPTDLETVLQKALEKEPERRYADAGGLAADLRQVLADKPVRARAPTTLYQVRKFVRRNRALTVSTCAVIAALVVAVGVLLVGNYNERLQKERMRGLFELVAEETLRRAPELGFAQEQRGFLEGLDARLAEELGASPRDRALRGYRARTLYELGALDQIAGDLSRAEGRFEEARRLREGLAEEDPDDLESRTHLSQVYARLGEIAGLRDEAAGERAWFQRSLEMDEALVSAHPGEGELIEDLGWSLERLAVLAQRRGDMGEAERLARRRLADAVPLAEREPDNWKFLYNAAQAHNLLESVARLDPATRAGLCREVLRLARRLLELQPRRAVFQRLWAAANQRAADLANQAGHLQEALTYGEAAFSLAVQLLVGDPRSLDYADFLRACCVTLLSAQKALGLHESMGATLARLRASAAIVGEQQPVGLLLLATADRLDAWPCESRACREAARERALQGFVTAARAPGAGTPVHEWVSNSLSDEPELLRELRRRLLSADPAVGREFAEVVRKRLGDSPALAAGEPPEEER